MRNLVVTDAIWMASVYLASWIKFRHWRQFYIYIEQYSITKCSDAKRVQYTFLFIYRLHIQFTITYTVVGYFSYDGQYIVVPIVIEVRRYLNSSCFYDGITRSRHWRLHWTKTRNALLVLTEMGFRQYDAI